VSLSSLSLLLRLPDLSSVLVIPVDPLCSLADSFSHLQDPENYWVSSSLLLCRLSQLPNLLEHLDQDLCVWPAYLKAHRPLFESGQVESGPIDKNAISGVTVLEAKELSMDEMVERALREIYEGVSSGKGREQWENPWKID